MNHGVRVAQSGTKLIKENKTVLLCATLPPWFMNSLYLLYRKRKRYINLNTEVPSHIKHTHSTGDRVFSGILQTA